MLKYSLQSVSGNSFRPSDARGAEWGREGGRLNASGPQFLPGRQARGALRTRVGSGVCFPAWPLGCGRSWQEPWLWRRSQMGEGRSQRGGGGRRRTARPPKAGRLDPRGACSSLTEEGMGWSQVSGGGLPLSGLRGPSWDRSPPISQRPGPVSTSVKGGASDPTHQLGGTWVHWSPEAAPPATTLPSSPGRQRGCQDPGPGKARWKGASSQGILGFLPWDLPVSSPG